MKISNMHAKVGDLETMQESIEDFCLWQMQMEIIYRSSTPKPKGQSKILPKCLKHFHPIHKIVLENGYFLYLLRSYR